MYPEIMVIPMREELTRLGIEELRTAEAVDAALTTRKGTALVIVNSICGCAARGCDRLSAWRLRRPLIPTTHLPYLRDKIWRPPSALAAISRATSVLPFDRDSSRRPTCVHDAAPRYRIARSSSHCG